MRIGEGLTRSEQETVIRRSADESTWDIYSSDPSVCHKLTKKFKPIEADESTNGRHFTVPKKAISFRSPRVMSDEQRPASIERMAHARNTTGTPKK